MDKPVGPTSHDVVARVRRVLRIRAVGHTGTLDPFASGLLVLLVGRATRLARFVEQQAKRYVATARLGQATTTDDLTGEPVDEAGRRASEPPSRQAVEDALRSFLGPQRQRPPSFSAKRLDGERSYARARRGEAVAPAEVTIVVHGMELLGYDYPDVRFRTTVSPGTYVRALARDLGTRLGTTAHLRELRRETIGPLRVEDAVPLEDIAPGAVIPPLAVLGHLGTLALSEDAARAVAHGQAVAVPPAGVQCGESDAIAAVAPGERLVAVGRVNEERFQPEVVLETPD
ncbi:MAG TPA: tRNA pseudouridine(55) synthase TruB [Gemmatimonadales bacterium]